MGGKAKGRNGGMFWGARVGESAPAGEVEWRASARTPFRLSPLLPFRLPLPTVYLYQPESPPISQTRAGTWNTTRVGEQASSLRDGVAYRGERELGPSSMTAVRFVLAPRAGFVRRSTRFQTLVENLA